MYNCFSTEYALQHGAVANEAAAGQVHIALMCFYVSIAGDGFLCGKRFIAFAGAQLYSANGGSAVCGHIHSSFEAVIMCCGIGHIGAEGCL